MIDYVDITPPPAIVQYVADVQTLTPPTTEYYPEAMSITGGFKISSNPTVYEVDYLSKKYHITDTGFKWKLRGNDDTYLSVYAFTYQGEIDTSPLYRYYAVKWYVPPDGTLSAMGDCYYLDSTSLPDGLDYDRIFEQPLPGGTDVIWLYNFGNALASMGDSINGILNFEVGGYNFFYLILGSGFFLYMGWCIIKWFIPL